MTKVAVLSSPVANTIYAFGDGDGSVCNFGVGAGEITGGKLSVADNGKLQILKTGAFTELKVRDGDPILITAGTFILPGVYTVKRIDDNNAYLLEDAQSSLPMISLMTIDFGAGSNPTAGDTVTFTPPTWFGAARTYTYRAALGAPVDELLIAAGSAITNARRIQRVINQTTVPPADYSVGSSGLAHVWASAPTAAGQIATINIQARMAFPPLAGQQPYERYGFITGSITGGSVQQGPWEQVSVSGLNRAIGAIADVNFRLPLQLGNIGNKRGVSRLIGAQALGGGADDARLTLWGAGYISDLAGATNIIPRADYFQGFGNIAPVQIVLKQGIYMPFGGEAGHVIEKAGLLFTISGTTPTVAIYFEDN